MGEPTGQAAVDPAQQQANAMGPSVMTAPGTAPQPVAQGGLGVGKLRQLMNLTPGQPPPPQAVAELLQSEPTQRGPMVTILQQTFGNGYTQTVLTTAMALQAPASVATPAIGAPGNGIATPALPQAAKNPADKISSGQSVAEQKTADATAAQTQDAALTKVEQDYIQGKAAVPPPPAAVYNDGDKRDGAQRARDAAKADAGPAHSPLQPPPVQANGLPTPDEGANQNGLRATATTTTTTPATRGMGMTTEAASIKIVALAGADPSPAAQADALARYRAAVNATLDEQIAALDAKKAVGQPATPTDPAANPQAEHDNLVAQKAKVAAASKEDLDAMVSANKLPIQVKDDTRAAATVTKTSGVNLGGALDGSAIVADNTKTAVVTASPGGKTVTKTTDDTNELSTKGVNIARGDSTTTVNADGSVKSDSSKTALTGGITDPLKLAKTSTSAQQDANGGSQVTTTGGATVGNGFGGATGGVSFTKLDPAKNPNAAPAAPAPAADAKAPDPAAKPADPAAKPADPAAKPADPAAKPDDAKGWRPTAASATGKAGIIQNDNGTGVQASLDDARVDVGNKQVAAGAYGAADGSLQMMVTPTEDGGCTITMTAIVRGKLGAFAGKRDPNDPVTSGNEAHGGGAAYGEASRTVTKSRKLSKDEAAQVLGNLDALASGGTGAGGGKKTFGTRAAAQAYSAVFGGSLDDLGKGGEANKDGESVSKIDEKGGGIDLKAGASTGDDANSRTGVNAEGGYEHVEIDGFKESATATAVTRSLVFGSRDAAHGSVGVSEGAAGMGVGGSTMTQGTRTYVFTVPKDQPGLLAEVRAIKDEAAAKKFAVDHPTLANGKVNDDIKQDGSSVNANVGPVGVAGSTTSTVDANIANGHHTEIGPDGRPVEKTDLSGTIDGTRKDDSSASLLGVKLAQANTTTTSHGTVDRDGQASLDVTQSNSSSNIGQNAPKGAADIKAMDKSDAAALLATGGPMAFVKKLAERVGEQNTVGAHFNNEAFNQLVGVAQGNQKAWNDAILVDYRSEWFHLRNQLNNPQPSKDWLAQDESPDKAAAYTLARMKAFADFVSVAGPAGQQAISKARGEYGPNAIGQTVSFPPSLQDQRPVFDDLCKQVEHLRATLLGFATSGDEASGKALIEKLDTQLGALRQKVQDANDHADPTLGLRAAAGIGDQQQTVKAWSPKFAAAIKAQHDGHSAADIATALDGQKVAASTQLWQAQGDQKKVVAAAKDKTAQVAAATPADNASNKDWQKFNKEFAGAAMDEYNAEKKLKDEHDAETKARADEAKTKAETSIPDYEQRCLASKGKAFSLLDQAVGAIPGYFGSESTTFDDLMKLGTLMREWAQEWSSLHGFYKDAEKPDGWRDDLRPGLVSGRFDTIKASEHISDNVKGYAGELKNQWGRL